MSVTDRRLSVAVEQAAPVPLAASFECAGGELLALVGPSGSGKTTLLRIIAGISGCTSGHIRYGDSVWFDSRRGLRLRPQQRAVAMVFQNYALFPHMSAQANIEAALGHLPEHRRAERATALLASVHLAGLQARYPHQLSGGQQQRVALARALAREPDVLLLDEPFSAVDQVTRRKLQTELVQLRRTLPMPIILVTHDLLEARALADRICILERGRTLQAGTPEAVLSRPVSPDVARLTDQPNVFMATLTRPAGNQPALLHWQPDLQLELACAPDGHPDGARVEWMIPADSIIVHRRDRPSRGERENPVDAVLVDRIPLGEMTRLVMAVACAPELVLTTQVPTHVLRRNDYIPGGPIRVSLRAEAIHVFPPAASADRSQRP